MQYYKSSFLSNAILFTCRDVNKIIFAWPLFDKITYKRLEMYVITYCKCKIALSWIEECSLFINLYYSFLYNSWYFVEHWMEIFGLGKPLQESLER